MCSSNAVTVLLGCCLTGLVCASSAAVKIIYFCREPNSISISMHLAGKTRHGYSMEVVKIFCTKMSFRSVFLYFNVIVLL